MDLSTTRVAVVGVGFIGVAHVEALRRIGVDVARVVGSSPERARAKVEAAGLPPAAESLASVLADPTIDAVHIASPNHVHAEQVIACLDAGKHVVCEKPLGTSSEQTAELVRRADAAGVVNAVCFNLRFYALNHEMSAMIADGRIGRPTLITGSYLQDWLLLDTDWNWRLDPAIGGRLRSLADIGSHWLDLARFVSGQDVVEVMADLHTTVPVRRRPPGPVETFGGSSPDGAANDEADLVDEPMSTDDAATVLLRFGGGARGTLTVSQVSAGHKNTLSIDVAGSERSVAWSSVSPDELWIGHRGRPNERFFRDGSAMAPSAASVTTYPPGHVEGYPDSFRALFAKVYLDIAAGRVNDRPAYPTFADGHDVQLVIEAIARSAETGSWQQVLRVEQDRSNGAGPGSQPQ